MLVKGKYNQAKTLLFSLFAPDGVSYISNAAFASGDILFMSDEGVEVNATNLPVDEGSGYSITLTAAEMQMARGKLYIVDQDATKVWLDTDITVETYGNASAEHEYDLDTTNPVPAPSAADVRIEMDANSADLNTIIANQGALTTAIAAVPTSEENRIEMDSNSADLNTIIANQGAHDARFTAARNEPGQGEPAEAVDALSKIDHLYKRAINKIDNNGTEEKMYNAAGLVVDHKRSVNEAAGTVTKEKVVTGP